jgi:hypothetical protein
MEGPFSFPSMVRFIWRTLGRPSQHVPASHGAMHAYTVKCMQRGDRASSREKERDKRVVFIIQPLDLWVRRPALF